MFISTKEQHDVIPDNTELFVSLCECVVDFEATNTQDCPVVLVCRYVDKYNYSIILWIILEKVIWM